MTDLSKLLNPEQFAAATAPDGPLLILAAAGTGKTRTLVYRVAHLVERGIRPWNILLLTFTNRAAHEMLERAEDVIGPAAQDVWGGTFHSIANRILRKYAKLLGYEQDFRILDGDEQKGLLSNIVKTMGYKAKEFISKDALASLISGARNRKMEFSDFIEPKLKALGVSREDLLTVESQYFARKKELKAMDFDDLLTNVLQLFQEHPEVLAEYQQRFHHILVDEYQDTNSLQSDFVEALAAGHNNLTIVGDDFQCIYTWRGADFRNIMDFKVHHPDAQIITLEQNYRSYGPILDLANACIIHNADQFPKTLRATRGLSTDAPSKPRLVELYNASEQAEAIANRLQKAHESGHRWSDMAILYRSHYQSIQIQILLAQKGIPHLTTSGAGVFELAHSKDLLSFFRIAEGQSDPLSLLRLLTMMQGMGEVTAHRIIEKLGPNFNLRESTTRLALNKALPPRHKELWKGVDSLLARYSGATLADSAPEPAPVTLTQTSLFGEPEVVTPAPESMETTRTRRRHIPGSFMDPSAAPKHSADTPLSPSEATEIFLDCFYRSYLRRVCDPVNAEERENDVRELALQIGNARDVRSFLADVVLLTNVDYAAQRPANGEEPDRVTLSTIHQAKGLEWPIVVLPWVVDGMFPSAKSIESSEDEADSTAEPVGVAEERRLFYVAVTRARDDLTLYTPQVRSMPDGSSIPCTPSRFIREVPETLFECSRKYGGGYGGRLSAFGGGYGGGGYGGGGYHGSGYRSRFSGSKTSTIIPKTSLGGGANAFSYKGKKPSK